MDRPKGPPKAPGRGGVRDYYARLADVLEPGLEARGDAPFWRSVAARRPGSVLEIGPGTGRITRLLAPDCERVVAVDLSRDMLRRARSSLAAFPHVLLVAGDVRRLALRCRFDMAVAANDPLAHLVDGGDRDRALERIAAHLAPGGRLVYDALWLTPSAARRAAGPDGYVARRTVERASELLEVRERWRAEAGTRRCRVRYTYGGAGGRTLAEAETEVRWWSLAELRRRLGRAGLRLVDVRGGYDGRPFEPGTAEALLVEAERRSPFGTRRRAVGYRRRRSRRSSPGVGGDLMATRLAEKECVPCKGGVPPLEGEELSRLLEELDAGWRVVDEHHLEKEFSFSDFREALEFTNGVGELAEEQGHHPDIHLAWGKVGVTVWTHKIDGLTESDFVFAAKVEQI